MHAVHIQVLHEISSYYIPNAHSLYIAYDDIEFAIYNNYNK